MENSDIFQHDYDLEHLLLCKHSERDFEMWVTPRFEARYGGLEFESYTSLIVQNIVKSASVFIDVGAHYGHYSLLVGKSNPSCKIVSIEPVEENFQILERNLAHNNIASATSINKAVSNFEGGAQFNISAGSSFSGFQKHPFAPALRQVNVQTVTLHTILAQYSENLPVLIKIDTEGHEIEVLDGMHRDLETRDNIRLIVEYNHTMLRVAGHQPEQLLEKLKELDYAVFFLDDNLRQYLRFPTQEMQASLMSTGVCNLLCVKKSRALNVAFFSHSSRITDIERSFIEMVRQFIQNHGSLCTVILPKGELSASLSLLGAAVINMNNAQWCYEDNISLQKLKGELDCSYSVLLDELSLLEKIAPDVICTNTISIPWGAITAAMMNRPHVWVINEFVDKVKFYIPLKSILDIVESSSNRIVTNSKALSGDTLLGKLESKFVEIVHSGEKHWSEQYYSLFRGLKDEYQPYEYQPLRSNILKWVNELREDSLIFLRRQLAERDAQLAAIYSSRAWVLSIWLKRVRLWILPPGSIQARVGQAILSITRKMVGK